MFMLNGVGIPIAVEQTLDQEPTPHVTRFAEASPEAGTLRMLARNVTVVLPPDLVPAITGSGVRTGPAWLRTVRDSLQFTRMVNTLTDTYRDE